MTMAGHLWIQFALPAAVLAFAAGCTSMSGEPSLVVAPHVRTNKSVDCSTIDRILQSLIKEGMTDEEKVLAVFHWVRRTIYHPDGRIRKLAFHFHYMVNVLGHGSCARQTTPIAVLLDRLGYRTQNWTRSGHHLMQVYYGGKWHAIDPHMTFYVYDRSTPPAIASIQQLQDDPTLVLDAVEQGRACPGFLLCGDKPETFAGPGGWKNYGEFPSGFNRPIIEEPFGRITLRRGESYVRTWMPGKHWFKANWRGADGGPYHTCGGKDRKDTVNWPLYEPHEWKLRGKGSRYRHWGSGWLVYEPDLSGDHYTDAVVRQTNVRLAKKVGVPVLVPVNPREPAEVIFSVNCPYVITAGELTLTPVGGGMVEISVSTDEGKSWKPVELHAVGGSWQALFVDEVNGSFTGYWLRVTTTRGAGIGGLKLATEFQLNPYSLPHLVPGKNVVRVEAGRYGAPLTVTYHWWEGEGWRRRRTARRIFSKNGKFTVKVNGPKYPRMESLTLSVAP